jgi:hypothetical protein
MGRTACTEPQCLYRGALYLVYLWYVLCHKYASIHLNPTYLSACALSCLLCFKSSSSIPLNGMKTCCTSGCVSNRLERKETYD